MRLTLAVFLLALLPTLSAATAITPVAMPPETAPAPSVPAVRVALETTAGRIVLELDPSRAPNTVANFLGYVDAGHYNGTVFHRVVPNLLVQGGAFTPDLQLKPDRAPIDNEAGNGLTNLRGTIAAARRPDTKVSATAQFFINVVDNPQFDAVDASNDVGSGYAVFGRVVEGMEFVDKMRAVETGPAGPFEARVPKTPIIINRATRLPASTGE